MSNDSRVNLYKAHRDAQDKYIYFILAAAGASIAFAVTQTQAAQLNWTKLALSLAILCWAFSFYSGCRQLWEISNLLQQNYQLMRVQDGIHPQFPNHPDFILAIEGSMEEQSSRSGRWGVRQFRFLILGAAFYMCWHGAEMALRTPNLKLPYFS